MLWIFPQSNIGWVSLRFTQSIFKHRYNIPVINTILKNRPFYTNVTYKSDATTLQLPGRSMFSSEPKSMHTSPSSGLFILVLEDVSSPWGQTRVAWGGWQRPAFPVYKLLVANSSTFQTGMLAAPPHFSSPKIESTPGKGSMPRGAEQGSWKHHAGFGQAYLRKASRPRPWVAGSFWLLGVKITVCNLNSSWSELCWGGLSSYWFLLLLIGPSHRRQKHQR